MSAVETHPAGPPVRVEERGDDLLVIVMDRPGARANLIDEAWLSAMATAIDRVERDRPRGLVLLSAKPGNFIAGADVSLIASLQTAEIAVDAGTSIRELVSAANVAALLIVPLAAEIWRSNTGIARRIVGFSGCSIWPCSMLRSN